jgi:glycosyltransferase involved in cell wall biosynthesis
MEAQKGADILPSIVRYTCQKDSDLSWIILGSGTLLDEVRASLLDVDRAQVLGNVPEVLVWHHMLESDIFVSLSRWECWPNTIMSALEAGPNIVATNIPGHIELLSQQTGAFLCDDVNQISEILLQIDSKFILRLPGRYTQRFSNEEFVQSMMKILS